MIITAGRYKGQKLITPSENIARPTLSKVRMGVFNTLYSLIGNFEGKSFLDLFGGSGVMGIEAASRGFEKISVFEKNLKAAEIIKKNYKKIGINLDLRIGDSEKLLQKEEKKFDVVYIDPPYINESLYKNVLSIVQGDLVVIEGLKDYISERFEVIKIKKYGDKYVSYLKML